MKCEHPTEPMFVERDGKQRIEYTNLCDTEMVEIVTLREMKKGFLVKLFQCPNCQTIRVA